MTKYTIEMNPKLSFTELNPYLMERVADIQYNIDIHSENFDSSDVEDFKAEIGAFFEDIKAQKFQSIKTDNKAVGDCLDEVDDDFLEDCCNYLEELSDLHATLHALQWEKEQEEETEC